MTFSRPDCTEACRHDRKQDAQTAKAWSVARTLDDMERAGVETSIVSLTQPAVTFAPPEVARRVARESNEWVAKLVADKLLPRLSGVPAFA